MTKEEIFRSGFVKAFIRDYFEEQIHNYYYDKDKLLYMLCENDEAKHKVTKEEINKIKTKIFDLGFEDLSYGYLLSCKPESLHNYIEANERFEFWLNRFAEEFEDSINDFEEITKAFCLYKGITKLSVEAIKEEGDFWEVYPNSRKPQIKELVVNIVEETELLSLIEYQMDEFKENEYWEIDFEEYQKFTAVSKPIEMLFNFCELLVQLNRLEMFNEFLNIDHLPPQKNKENTTQEELIKISQDENKFLRGIPMQVVIDHFKVFTTSKNKNGEYYLTDFQLISFLKKCFLNDRNEPIQKINFATGEKGFVIKRFYQFYEIALNQYFVPNPKEPFIDRFTECFEFGEKSSFKSFFKNKNIKKQW